MSIGIDQIVRVWLAVRPIRKLKERRAAKRAKKTGQAVPVVNGGSMAGYKTYTGIVVAALGVLLGWFGVGESEAGTLAAQIGSALDQVLTVGGLLFAAYGRAKAKPAV